MSHHVRTRIAGGFCFIALSVFGGSAQLNAQEVGSELVPEGVEISDEDREALEEMYEFFANSLGMSFEEAREQGLTYTELEQRFRGSPSSIDEAPGTIQVVEPASGQLIAQESSRSGPATSFGQRRILQFGLLLVFGVIATAFNWVRDSLRGRSARTSDQEFV